MKSVEERLSESESNQKQAQRIFQNESSRVLKVIAECERRSGGPQPVPSSPIEKDVYRYSLDDEVYLFHGSGLHDSCIISNNEDEHCCDFLRRRRFARQWCVYC